MERPTDVPLRYVRTLDRPHKTLTVHYTPILGPGLLCSKFCLLCF